MFDVRVYSTLTPLQISSQTSRLPIGDIKEKKVPMVKLREVEHAYFSPLVFSFNWWPGSRGFLCHKTSRLLASHQMEAAVLDHSKLDEKFLLIRTFKILNPLPQRSPFQMQPRISCPKHASGRHLCRISPLIYNYYINALYYNYYLFFTL